MGCCDFSCRVCGKNFSLKKSLNEESTLTCPICESTDINKIMHDSMFKGSPYGNPHSSCSCGCSKSSGSSCSDGGCGKH